MANNPYVNKVVKADGTTIMDITGTTATATDVASGKYFFTASGQLTLGTASSGSGDGYVWQDENGYVHLSDEQGTQPTYDTLTVNASGTFTPSQGHAYNSVVVASGTAGTPSASKGTVSNNSVTVTPSVTNTTGWITGSTKTGTAVTVSASELVSGTKSITANGTNIDVTNYASVDVSVVPTHTATLTVSGTADSGNRVKYDNVTHYTDGDTFQFIAGGTLEIRSVGQRAGGTIIIDGVTVATSQDWAVTYNYTLPNGDIEIALSYYSAGSVSITSSGGATQHVIHLEFTDSTDTDIDVYYDDALISTMITAYEPTTYGQKTVDSAELDGVEWYTRPTATWETVYDGVQTPVSDTPYNYLWISTLGDVYPIEGEEWRVTVDDVVYYTTATQQTAMGVTAVIIGNPKYSGGQDDGSSIPLNLYNLNYGALMGDTELSANVTHTIKLERKVTA